MVWSGPISPYHRGTRDIPIGMEEQFDNLFANMGDILDAAGATWDHIGKINFYVADVDDRAFKEALGKHWLKHFPDKASRPARHTIHVAKLMPYRFVTASFMAYISD